MNNPKYINKIEKVSELTKEETERLQEVTTKFAFRINEYYMNLIDWNDPNDPLRKLVIPSVSELNEFGVWDASDEQANYVATGCQHKYRNTALLLVSEVCGAYCRYCFRKRLFRDDVHEASLNVDEGIDYISRHPEINNVLLTGGDPLTLSTRRLNYIFDRLAEVEHIRIIRIGSKLPVFNPMRIYNDPQLINLFQNTHANRLQFYLMAHVNHPRELTIEARQAFAALQQAGVRVMNQTPILKGINDDVSVLAELLNELSWQGIVPYYFFVNRPVIGNEHFTIPLKQIYRLVEEAKARTSGLGKTVRLVMSHSSGKIEILAIEHGMAYLKYHQSKYGEYGQFMCLPCPDDAEWFDDLLQSGEKSTNVLHEM